MLISTLFMAPSPGWFINLNYRGGVVKITALCSEHPGELEPSHGFGVLVNGHVLFDGCAVDAASRFAARRQVKPLVGVVGVPDNPHHVGGFTIFRVPVVRPTSDVALRIRGVEYRVFRESRENVLYVDGVVISPCGLYTIPYHKLSQRGVKARCVVGGLGGTAHNPYLLPRILAELRLLGVRCVVALHTAPQLVKELEKRFNVYRLGAGSTLEL
jgi:7,8-dihydropterin-6-yl-methyl-4-(beta-D-ribofuranosyl)aminobenzene 5'-phosphate synthase